MSVGVPDGSRGERRFHTQTALIHESVRLQTFANWKVSFLDAKQLAAAGFFYLQKLDHVQCAFCQGIVGYWDPGDDPLQEHAKHFPSCPFVTAGVTGNVPLNAQGNTAALYAFLDHYYAFRVANTPPKLSAAPYRTDGRGVEGDRAAYPQFSTHQSRLHTFARWPREAGLSEAGLSEAGLAEAGWFYTGLSDWLQCFHCGGGLHTWRRGDDPWLDHAKFYPSCTFAQTQQRAEGVACSKEGVVYSNEGLARGSEGVAEVADRAVGLSKDEERLLLLHPISQRLVQQGFEARVVQAALRTHLETHGVAWLTLNQGLEAVFDHQDPPRMPTPPLNPAPPLVQA